MLRIFIGYDPRQEASFAVAARSAFACASKSVAIVPLRLEALAQDGLTRTGLTPFTFSRFIAPYLCNFDGPPAIFVDADVMWRGDPYELVRRIEPGSALWIRREPQFERCAVMVFDPAHPDLKILTPDFIQRGDPFNLECWTRAIGDLPPEWHHLVLYDPPSPAAKLVHFTAGVPSFPELAHCEHAEEYRRHIVDSTGVKSTWLGLMGNTRHVATVNAWKSQRFR